MGMRCGSAEGDTRLPRSAVGSWPRQRRRGRDLSSVAYLPLLGAQRAVLLVFTVLSWRGLIFRLTTAKRICASCSLRRLTSTRTWSCPIPISWCAAEFGAFDAFEFGPFGVSEDSFCVHLDFQVEGGFELTSHVISKPALKVTFPTVVKTLPSKGCLISFVVEHNNEKRKGRTCGAALPCDCRLVRGDPSLPAIHLYNSVPAATVNFSSNDIQTFLWIEFLRSSNNQSNLVLPDSHLPVAPQNSGPSMRLNSVPPGST
jgi:hypothetical protein